MIQVSGTAAIVFGANKPHNRQLLKSACEAQGWTKMVTRPPSKTAALDASMREACRTMLPSHDGVLSVRALDQDVAFEAIKVQRGNTRNTELFLCSCELSGEHDVKVLDVSPHLDRTTVECQIQNAYDNHRNNLSASQVRTVVAGCIRMLKGVGLGGPNVYYVPNASVSTWHAWRDSSQLWNYHAAPLEVASSPETVEHIIASLNEEVSESSQQVLAAISAGDLSPKEAKALAKKAQIVIDKIKSYESALGQQLDWMSGPLENAQAALGVSTLLAASV